MKLGLFLILCWAISLTFLPGESATPLAHIPRFETNSVRLRMQETYVLSFAIDEKTTQQQLFQTRIIPADAAEILQSAKVLPGQKIGFLQLRTTQPGLATLHVGESTQELQITESSASSTHGPNPVILAPMAGAHVYGTISVGVEIPRLDPRVPVSEPRLILPFGQELKPRTQSLPPNGAHLLYVFDLNADVLPIGPLKLVAEMKTPTDQRLTSDPVYLQVIRPDPAQMISGACADRLDRPRPTRFGEKLPVLAPASPEAPQGYVLNVASDPAWCLKETIAESGYYQFTIRARGDAAAGSYPSVGLIVDDQEKPVTATRLVDQAWQRLPIGQPIYLEAGVHTLTPRFLNDFHAAKGFDRNLYLERFELVKVRSDPFAKKEEPAMMMMMAPKENAGQEESPLFTTSLPLRVAFAKVLHGQLVQGPLELSAGCWTSTTDSVPTTELLVNGQSIARQQGTELLFHLPPQALVPGANRLQLRSRLASGITAESPAQTVFLPQRVTGAVPQWLRYTFLDDAWDAGMAQRREKDDKKQPTGAAFYTNGEATLTLPDNLAGEFTLRLEAKGQVFRGPPIVEAFLQQAGQELQPLGQAKISGGNYRPYKLGQVQLVSGPKRLILRYSNDEWLDKQGDRNWWLRALRVEETVPSVSSAPQIVVTYPRPNTAPLIVHEAQVLVVEAFHTNGLDSVDLEIDGQPQQLRLPTEKGSGRLVVPLLTRHLTDGKHRARVLVRANNGQQAASAEIPFRVTAQPAEATPAYARAIHLLNRFGYGPETEELADVLTMGEATWLRDRLTRPWNDPGEQAAWGRAWMELPDPTNRGHVIPRTLTHLLRSPNPVRNRFVLWTENHFSTWIQKTEPPAKWIEHTRFLELGVARFRDLLLASATSPAMLIYLDQHRSYTKKLNENYAREIMELHTLGVDGGYTQEDVTNLAMMLTGWTLSQDSPLAGDPGDLTRTFRYEPMLNGADGCQLFGLSLPRATPDQRLTRVLTALEMLAAHPMTAHFISRKLAEHYVGVPAPPKLVEKLAQEFQSSGGEIADVLMVLAQSPEFWATQDQPKMATPLDFSLRLCRLTESYNPYVVADFLRKSGTGLFDRPTPDGYPEADAAYADSNAMLQRWRFTKGLQGNLRQLLPTANSPAWDEPAREEAIDLVALRLLGLPLSQNSREAALIYLTQTPSAEPDSAKLVTSFLTQLPETNLR